MSQITKLFDGTALSDIETLSGDVGGPVGPDALFNIGLITGDGLTSSGDPLNNQITFSLDYHATAIGQTIGAVNINIAAIDLGAIPTTYIIEAKVVGFEATTPACVGYNVICVARTDGAAATIVGIQDKYNAEDVALGLSDANFVAVGNTVAMRLTGTAALTINWRVTTNYVRVI